MLLNIDKPHRTATLHQVDCRRLPDPLGSKFKPLDPCDLGRDGAWFTVADEGQAREIARKRCPQADFIRCQNC